MMVFNMVPQHQFFQNMHIIVIYALHLIIIIGLKAPLSLSSTVELIAGP